MTKEEYILLYEKWQAGDITPAEKQLLEDYKDDYQFLEHEWDPSMGVKEQMKDAIYTRLQKSIDTASPNKKAYLWYWVAAASIVLICSATLIVLNWKGVNNSNLPYHVTQVKNDIRAGQAKAVLNLADGTTVMLDNSANGLLTRQGNSVVTKRSSGQLIYGAIRDTVAPKVMYNTVSIPRGGEYQLILADGTKVWLNASSSLKFPVFFAGHERRVELTGEAYFEVAKNPKMPFKVVMKQQEIQVLGTHFNVNAYPDEDAVKTTLLEGSVKIKTPRISHSATLKPGEQSVLNDAGIYVAQVNVADAVAWKNGDFLLNEDIESIMKKISRWYDVDVVFKTDKDPQLRFGGTISRSKSLSAVLQIIEATGNVHFKIEGRKVFVMK